MNRRAVPPHRWSFVVARVASIDVRVHVSFLVLVLLFLIGAPEPGLAGRLWSVVWLLVVFASVVAHELAHCVVARSRGGEVHEILLFPLGGVSKLERLPEAPRDELAMAIAGPLASLGIGVAAAGLCVATGRDLLPIDFVTGPWLARVAWINVLLGVFNLLPAFPLDGGRVFRALLERRLDLLTATRIATRTGHALAVVLAVVGVLLDPWLLLIGLFVYFGASAEEAATLVHVRLQGHRVRDAMREGDIDGRPVCPPAPRTDVDTALDVDTPLDLDVMARLREAGGAVMVTEHGRPIGTLSVADVVRLVDAPDVATQEGEGMHG